MRALRNLMVEQDILTAEQIEAKIAEVKAAFEAEGRPVMPASVPWDNGLGPAGAKSRSKAKPS